MCASDGGACYFQAEDNVKKKKKKIISLVRNFSRALFRFSISLYNHCLLSLEEEEKCLGQLIISSFKWLFE
jgi:hypothetical protein